ncbi:cyclin-dependent kinase, putative [Eimeria necatrix]|uniref:Cyclin-dependent kinase, putative n=1 Tax=Eimeria necatrix TaxID=51315 RepID=U6MRV8_9EIME|nr:cyclin-dependent kinase, putative [Eimeria necatrix]CDJ66741.1 cyclin-dependent kinase, putative [Eimeria necatrix]
MRSPAARQRHQREPAVPPAPSSLPPCRILQRVNAENASASPHLQPSAPLAPLKDGHRSGGHFPSLQRLCDCCVSPKRRRGPRRSRHNVGLTVVAATPEHALEHSGRRLSFSARSSSCNSTAKTSRRESSAVQRSAETAAVAAESAASAQRRGAVGTCYSGGYEAEALLCTCARDRSEAVAGTASLCSTAARLGPRNAATAYAAISSRPTVTVATAVCAVENNSTAQVLTGRTPRSEVFQPQLPETQSQQRQQGDPCPGLFPHTRGGQCKGEIYYKAATVASAAAAGAAAAACNCGQQKAAKAAAMRLPGSPLTLLPMPGTVKAAFEKPSAEKSRAGPTTSELAADKGACGCEPLNGSSAVKAMGPSVNCYVKTTAAAAKASHEAYMREELLHQAESRYTAVFVPVDRRLMEQVNDEFIRSDISRYPVKNTPCGIVFYSPRYSDDRFTYRHVLLSAGVKSAAEEIASATKREMRELILRRPQQQEDSTNLQNQLLSDEVSEESDDSEPDESSTAKASGAPSQALTHQDLGRLLQQIAEIATSQQARRQKHLLQQQQLAIARAVEKANRLLLLMVQLQRAPKQIPQRTFDRMKCLLAGCFFGSLPPISGENQEQSAARRCVLQRGSIGRLRKLLVLLLQCVAAITQQQQTSDATEMLLLQHKLLMQHKILQQQKVLRYALRGLEREQQNTPASCLPENPEELEERQPDQLEGQQKAQQQPQPDGNQEVRRLEALPYKKSSYRGTSAMRLRKRRGPSLASSPPVATPQIDTPEYQQKRWPRAAPAAADVAACNDTAAPHAPAALPSGISAARKVANPSTTATAAEGTYSPSSQRKQKRRRYPLRH